MSIIGAGLGGLTLARLLQMRGVTVRVYERDVEQGARMQGGSLDLHEDSGQLALQRAGLDADFRMASRPDGQHSRVFDQHGVLRAELRAEDEAQTRPEIDRGALRDLLLASLVPGTVVWGQRLVHVERNNGQHPRLIFKGAPPVDTDLVVGCDGGKSKVRPLRSDCAPRYTGVTFVQAVTADADSRYPALARLVGPGAIMAPGDNKALMAQRNGDGSIRIYVALRVPEAWGRDEPHDWNDPEAVRARLLEYFEGWDASLLALLRNADPAFLPWPLYAVSPDQAWRPQPDITLLGDAAHIMPPFTGKGANYAMLDALELADCLTSDSIPDLAAALAVYETIMLARMKPAIQETLASQDMIIASDAPAALVAVITGKMNDEP